jgi:trehalose 6-phosphate synthase/phosphatase
MREIKRLVCVSNRLPIVLQRIDDQWQASPSSGGLVSALEPILRNHGGMWIGWPGADDGVDVSALLQSTAATMGYQLQPVPLTSDEEHGFYHGFSNEILWPLFHGLPTRCNFDPKYWHSYESANRKFAEATLEHTSEEDFILVHDYHLMLLGTYLRRSGRRVKTAFFLHIPFPAPENFLKLPWRAQVLEGLLSHDLVGFQTLQDRNNFLQCLRWLDLPELTIDGLAAGSVVKVCWHDHELRAGVFPISVDYDALQDLVTSDAVAETCSQLRQQFGSRQLIIGMDRLDYTKGIPERLLALRLALERYPELKRKVSLVQVTVPSREKVPEYEQLLAEIERMVGNINGEFTVPGEWVPIHYLHRSLSRPEAMGYLRAGDVALVTPLRDGMNLVAKEYCACDVDQNGVLVLSEFAGAAAELKGDALLVNPNDIEGMAEAIYKACTMPPEERTRRMARLRSRIRQNNIFDWVGSLLAAAVGHSVDHFPLAEEYVPDLSTEWRAGCESPG